MSPRCSRAIVRGSWSTSSLGRALTRTSSAFFALSWDRMPPGVSSPKRRCKPQTAWVRSDTSSSRRSHRQPETDSGVVGLDVHFTEEQGSATLTCSRLSALGDADDRLAAGAPVRGERSRPRSSPSWFRAGLTDWAYANLISLRLPAEIVPTEQSDKDRVLEILGAEVAGNGPRTGFEPNQDQNNPIDSFVTCVVHGVRH